MFNKYIPLIPVFAFFIAILLLVRVQNAQSQSAPYPPSSLIETITWDFDNLVRQAPGSDLWPTTWADDDNIYTSWGDGGGFGGTNSDGRVSLGFGRIEGDPNNFTGYNIWGGKNPENPATFGGKSAGIISVQGVLYSWINTQNASLPDIKLAWSSDHGATWQLSSWKFDSSVFAPSTFLNFGKDSLGARDNYVYTYGGEWLATSPVYLMRVSEGQILNRDAYEFFAGLDTSNNPIWTTDVNQRQPVFEDPSSTDVNGANHASVIYNLGIQRYILAVSHGDVASLGIFDAPEPWGPWTTISYYDNWGGFSGSALIYSLPTKWISGDGQTMWLIFSSSGQLDSFNLVKATLTLKSNTMPTVTEQPTPTSTEEPIFTQTPVPIPEPKNHQYLPLIISQDTMNLNWGCSLIEK